MVLMLVDLDLESVEKIYLHNLIEDWQHVKRELKEYKGKETLLPHQKEDFKYLKKMKKAYEHIIRYSHCEADSEEILGPKKKKKEKSSA
jgi:hypothetical protein